MIDEQGERWTEEWLRLRGLHDWAEYLHKLSGAIEAPVAETLLATPLSFSRANGKAHPEEIHR